VVEGPKLHCCPRNMRVPVSRDEVVKRSRWMRPLEGSVLHYGKTAFAARARIATSHRNNMHDDSGECGNPSEPTTTTNNRIAIGWESK